MGSSAAILAAGYNIDSLMLRYQGVDWRDKANWGCNAGCACGSCLEKGAAELWRWHGAADAAALSVECPLCASHMASDPKPLTPASD